MLSENFALEIPNSNAIAVRFRAVPITVEFWLYSASAWRIVSCTSIRGADFSWLDRLSTPRPSAWPVMVAFEAVGVSLLEVAVDYCCGDDLVAENSSPSRKGQV